jgi:hypothetical protein
MIANSILVRSENWLDSSVALFFGCYWLRIWTYFWRFAGSVPMKWNQHPTYSALVCLKKLGLMQIESESQEIERCSISAAGAKSKNKPNGLLYFNFIWSTTFFIIKKVKKVKFHSFPEGVNYRHIYSTPGGKILSSGIKGGWLWFQYADGETVTVL